MNHSLFVFALVLCFGLAAVADLIGIAGIIGAFLAGVALSEATDDTDLHKQAQALTEFTTPFFLVNIGLKLNLSIFLSSEVVILSLIVTILAILTKFIGCGLPALKMGKRRAMQVGVGMIPRGEVGIVVAPPFIKMAFSGERVEATETEADEELQYDIRRRLQ